MSGAYRRILVVDDDPASRDLMAYFLKSLGYQVAMASDGGKALNMNLGDDIGLVILDVHMPGYEGPDVLAMVRGRALSRPVGVIAVTADDSTDVRGRMDGLGVDGFLTKPVDLDALREAVDRLLPGQSNVEGPLQRRVRERGVGRRLQTSSVDPRAGLRH
jgi:DNA-binding response OmpR family regulator